MVFMQINAIHQREESSLEQLIVAFLLGEGDIIRSNENDYILLSDIVPSNQPYIYHLLEDDIKTSSSLISYELKDDQVTLHVEESLIKPYYDTWYQGDVKAYQTISYRRKIVHLHFH
ncbi:hypothetical protein [Salipaludibacillus sp. CF4.18]|uniref:hypothetical protein n=1 Tax=Salipaludibacillus sp. CF4.18 TaxID=3373081 RepID=UPI003EE49024